MPWSVIMMVCGVSVLIDVMDKAGGLNFLVEVMASVAGPTTICFWTAFVPAVISAYSSSSGVVMPMFLPMTPGLVELTGGDPIAKILLRSPLWAHCALLLPVKKKTKAYCSVNF